MRHVGNIGVGETATAAQGQHGGNTLQKNIPLLDRQHTRCAHDNLQLGIGQANHGPDDEYKIILWARRSHIWSSFPALG